MQKATECNSTPAPAPPRRRGFLAALAAAAAAVPLTLSTGARAAPGEAAGPDAELLDVCAEAMRLDYLAETAADFDAFDALMFGWDAAVDRITKIPALTRAGIQAKSAIVRHLMAPMQPRWAEGDTHDQTVHDPIVWSLVNDLAGAAS